MQHLIDKAEDLLAQPTWKNLQHVRSTVAELLCEAERVAAGECDDQTADQIRTVQALSYELLGRFKSEQRRQQLAGLTDSRQAWLDLPDPVQQLIRGTPSAPPHEYGGPRSPIGGPPSSEGSFYASLFGPVRPSGFASAAEFFSIVGNAQHHPALISAAALGEDGVGGLLVPTEYEARMLDHALHQSIVLPRAEIAVMQSRNKLVAGLDGQNQGDPLSPFGMTFAWLRENQAETPGTAGIRAIELCARPLGTYVQASNEIYSDAGELENLLTAGMGTGMAEAMDHYFLRGSGAGTPLGVMNSPALLTLPKVSAQTAGTIVLRNVLDILSRHASPNTAVWVVSPSTLPSLFTQTIIVGGGGSHVPLVQIAPGQNGQQQMNMLGRPLFASHRMPALGTAGDIGLYSFEYYYVGLRQGTAIERSAHAGFLSNAQVWRCVSRFDGQPRVSQAMVGADGVSYSPFVTIETRA